MTPIEAQASATLKNFEKEVKDHGLTPAADAMWQHLLQLKQVRDQEQAGQRKPS